MGKRGRTKYEWQAHPLRDAQIGKRKPTPPKRRRSSKLAAISSRKGEQK